VAKAKAQAAVEKAQRALEKAKARHRQAFREELARLFNQYQLKLVPNVGDEMLILEHDGELKADGLPK
jgi:hypothetical protein